MLDLPGIIEGAAAGRGRGREVIAVARSADLVMMVLDGAREQNNQHRDILSRELETMGIRLNRKPPGIYYKKKATGGVKFNTTCTLTQMGDNPQDACSRILGSYRIHNAEVLFREDCSLDDLIDVIEGNRKYVRCLYVYNKIDTLSIEEVDELARKPDSVVISIYMDLNLDFMLQKMWDYLGLIRIYTKRRGQQPDLNEPIVLSSERYTVLKYGDGLKCLQMFCYGFIFCILVCHISHIISIVREMNVHSVATMSRNARSSVIFVFNLQFELQIHCYFP